MRFHTENEIENFDFKEAFIEEIRVSNLGSSSFFMALSNVKILENNSCNRDVRTMRTNGLELRIVNPQIISFIEEGFKLYNANGVLQKEVPDTVITPEQYTELCRDLAGATVYSLKKEGDHYNISIDCEIDDENHEYQLIVKGEGDSEEWDRFMNLAEGM